MLNHQYVSSKLFWIVWRKHCFLRTIQNSFKETYPKHIDGLWRDCEMFKTVVLISRVDSRLAPIQWETSLQSNTISLDGRKPRISSGPVFCLLLGVSSDYAQPITGQVTEVTCPVIGWAQPELTRSKRQKTGPDFSSCLTISMVSHPLFSAHPPSPLTVPQRWSGASPETRLWRPTPAWTTCRSQNQTSSKMASNLPISWG